MKLSCMGIEEVRPTAAGELPVVHGYFREHLFMGSNEKADIWARFEVFAEREGYQLGKIFMEKVETPPAALEALIQAAIEDKAAVVMPSLLHLAIFGHPFHVRDGLVAAIGGPVLVSDPAV